MPGSGFYSKLNIRVIYLKLNTESRSQTVASHPEMSWAIERVKKDHIRWAATVVHFYLTVRDLRIWEVIEYYN